MSNKPGGLPLSRAHVEQIFPKLTPAQISRIAAHGGQMRTMEPGDVLVEQGDSTTPFFVVVSGELEIVRPCGAVETLITEYMAQASSQASSTCSPAAAPSFEHAPRSQAA